jgi:Amt family ammonium transporter
MKRIGFLSLITMGLAAFSAAPAFAEEPSVADTLINLAYSIDTFYFLMSGALVMWMACGFARSCSQ